MPYHALSYCTTPYHIIHHHTILHDTICHALSYCTTPYHIIHYHTLLHHTTYHTMPYHTAPHHITLYTVIQYCIIPYAIPCPIILRHIACLNLLPTFDANVILIGMIESCKCSVQLYSAAVYIKTCVFILVFISLHLTVSG